MMDPDELALLAQTLRKTMTSTAPGPALRSALAELGWREMLAEMPEVAVPLVFRLLGETGAHAAVLADVVGQSPLPYAGGAWVEWSAADIEGDALELPLRQVVQEGDGLPVAALAAGRVAVGWWLLGSGRAMLALARQHAVDRVQFGRPIASFQAVRHKLAETLVALDGARPGVAIRAGRTWLAGDARRDAGGGRAAGVPPARRDWRARRRAG